MHKDPGLFPAKGPGFPFEPDEQGPTEVLKQEIDGEDDQGIESRQRR